MESEAERLDRVERDLRRLTALAMMQRLRRLEQDLQLLADMLERPPSEVVTMARVWQRGLVRYARDAGRWITIGAREGPDGKRHGGSRTATR